MSSSEWPVFEGYGFLAEEGRIAVGIPEQVAENLLAEVMTKEGRGKEKSDPF